MFSPVISDGMISKYLSASPAMTTLSRILFTVTLLGFPFVAVSCRGEEKPPAQAKGQQGLVGIEDMVKFRNETRQLYNNRKFAELEALAEKIRSGKERFPGGSWKIQSFYECMDCRDEEPESMWKLHEKIHQDWEAKYPESITAQVAKAEFYTTYAWHARSDKLADEVTQEGWQLFNERLAQARTVLDQSKHLKPTCPMWYSVSQTVALGQSWDRAEYDALFKEATKFEPEFHPYDSSRAKFLLPRWNGAPGEWEKTAEEEIALRGAIGHQIYAGVVFDQSVYYGNVFTETKASWRDTRKGYEELTERFPTSAGLLNCYCRLACLAGDRKQAKILFAKIGDMKVPTAWRTNEFNRAKAWAMEGK
jgi:hypothetical protein